MLFVVLRFWLKLIQRSSRYQRLISFQCTTYSRRTVCHSFSQPFEVEPRHFVVKNGDHLSKFDQSQNISESRYWLLIGFVKQLDSSRNQRSGFLFFRDLWNPRKGSLFQISTKKMDKMSTLDEKGHHSFDFCQARSQ